mmetsp:Transcript_29817/g.92255  ORF Transcript_29817/g.92255 Transcript_29817/m.92255 type:complete len:109 (-) Transcript_29817:30-356(-)
MHEIRFRAERVVCYRQAPKAVASRFAVEELTPADRKAPPVGVFHLMRTVPHTNRSKLLALCPEAKLLFPAVHDPRCKVACPSKRFLDGPLRDWTACEKAGGDECALAF